MGKSERPGHVSALRPHGPHRRMSCNLTLGFSGSSRCDAACQDTLARGGERPQHSADNLNGRTDAAWCQNTATEFKRLHPCAATSLASMRIERAMSTWMTTNSPWPPLHEVSVCGEIGRAFRGLSGACAARRRDRPQMPECNYHGPGA